MQWVASFLAIATIFLRGINAEWIRHSSHSSTSMTASHSGQRFSSTERLFLLVAFPHAVPRARPAYLEIVLLPSGWIHARVFLREFVAFTAMSPEFKDFYFPA